MGYILLVEDDVNISETMRIILEMEGLRVIAARTEAEAFAALEVAAPDLVLLDYYLDGKTPDRFVKCLHVLYQKPDALILVTAAAHSEKIAEALGIKYLIKKPFQIEELLDVMKECRKHL